jgi:hypothetical protein
MTAQTKYKAGNLNFGEYKLIYVNDTLDFLTMQKVIIDSFIDFVDDFIQPYGLEFCFEYFDRRTQLSLLNSEMEAFMLKLNRPNLSFLPIWSNTQEIEIEAISKKSIHLFVLSQLIKREKEENLYGLSHLSFQTGLFRLPEPTKERSFSLELENQINNSIIYPCISDDWFESPLKTIFLFPPIELNFSREPYSKAWSLSIISNWDIYSHQNQLGFKVLCKKINLLLQKGWELEFSSFKLESYEK